MKTYIFTFVAALFSAAAQGATITITFDHPAQTAAPGQTLQIFGTITNTSATTVFLNQDDLNVSGQSYTTNDLFFSNAPISLAPNGQAGSSSGDIELFDLTLTSSVTGIYTLFGGRDGGAQDNLASANFSVTAAAVPEPSAVCLLLVGFCGVLVWFTGRLERSTVLFRRLHLKA